MASRTRSSSSFRSVRKGQFFLLSTVAIVTILFFVGRWVDPLAQSDTSGIAGMEELFTFDNIQEKTSSVVKNSDNCDDLNFNMQEYKSFIENFASEKNYKIKFAYLVPSCSEEGATVAVSLRIQSERVDAQKDFSVVWP